MKPCKVGVVSWGIGCASGRPGAYSRISEAYEWIQCEVCEGSVHAPEAGFDCNGVPCAWTHRTGYIIGVSDVFGSKSILTFTAILAGRETWDMHLINCCAAPSHYHLRLVHQLLSSHILTILSVVWWRAQQLPPVRHVHVDDVVLNNYRQLRRWSFNASDKHLSHGERLQGSGESVWRHRVCIGRFSILWLFFSWVVWCTGAEVAQKSRSRSRLTISARKYHAVNSWIGIRLLVERDVHRKRHFENEPTLMLLLSVSIILWCYGDDWITDIFRGEKCMYNTDFIFYFTIYS